VTFDDLEHGELGDALVMLAGLLQCGAVGEVERVAPAAEPGFAEIHCTDGGSWLIAIGTADPLRAAMLLEGAAAVVGHLKPGAVH
jgi:hypothetical protein